jgi:hypothetical protein
MYPPPNAHRGWRPISTDPLRVQGGLRSTPGTEVKDGGDGGFMAVGVTDSVLSIQTSWKGGLNNWPAMLNPR